MKTLRQICAAFVLSLMLTVSVLAGHIETPSAPTTPPPSTTTTTTATSILITVLSLIRR